MVSFIIGVYESNHSFMKLFCFVDIANVSKVPYNWTIFEV